MIYMTFNNRNDNIGDLLIFMLLEKEIRKHRDTCYLMCAPKYATDKPLRFREAFIKSMKYRIKKKERTILIDSPGARFKPRNSLNKSKKKILIEFLWRTIGAKTSVIGISIDSKPEAKDYKHYSKIGVRDKSSYSKISLISENAFFCPDMALLLEPSLKILPTKKAILSFRESTPDNNYTKGYGTELRKKLSIIMEELRNKSIDCAFFSQVDEDYNFNKDLAKTFQCEFISSSIDNFNFSEFYSEYQMVISNRLHVLLPGMSSGLSPVPLISRDHTKIKNLFESYGWGELIEFFEEESSINKLIQRMSCDKNDIRKDLYDQLLKKKREIEDSIKEFIKHE